MKSVYRVLAYLVAVEVAVQAAVIAFAAFGLSHWIGEGNVLDKATMESHSDPFTGSIGFAIHAINGQFLVPLIAILLLVVSFFAAVQHGVRWAGLVFGLVVIQVVLGIVAGSVPGLGLLHGLNALLLFTAALLAGHRVGAPHSEEKRVEASSSQLV